MEKKFTLPSLGYEVTLGKFAGQAAGAAWLQQGGTVVLATVCSSPSKEFPGFLPLSVDYRENFSAAGKIPGGYLKREGKFSDNEILKARIIDRAIRPLFPANYFNQLQVQATVYSVDKLHVPHTLGLLASSIALTISNIPFLGPVGICEVARINGQWVTNPTYPQTVESDVRLLFAGTHEGINMVEGSAAEISNKDFLDAMYLAHEVIREQVAWQLSIKEQLNVQKEEIVDQFDWSLWTKRVEDILQPERVKSIFSSDKLVRSEARETLEKEFFTTYEKEAEETKISKTFLSYVFDATLKNSINEMIFTLGKRIDSRAFDQVRTITTEVGLLPFTHGSSLFTRGRTQALASVTLGSAEDEAMVDNLMAGTIENSFMLHYNFPAFSVGEVRPNRGPGRREIGHGHLAASAIERILPANQEFPYTIRLVVDILESDGSSSMATVCSSNMALMNAGVPIKKMVAGIAMGLLMNKNGEIRILSDIAGIEDEFGLMDFKVAGTDKGIVAIQMDIKYKGGLPREIFEKALEQANRGYMHILGEMRKVMTEPNPNLSPLVPRFVTFKIARDKIGAVIGKGGAVIKEIIEKTETSIDIKDDGLVKIFGHPGEKLDLAANWVKTLSGQIHAGMRYEGTVKRIAEFGIFVEIVPGLDGLVHVSTVPRPTQEEFLKRYKPEDKVLVEVLDYDSETGRIRLKIVQQQESVHDA